jgi:DNA ligase (NAD+)
MRRCFLLLNNYLDVNEKQAKKRIEKLKETISHHRYLYHVLDKEEISSSALDSLKKELYDLEQKFPQFITPDSPTQRVEGKPLKEFKKVKHYKRMFSLQDAFTEEDVFDFEKRIKRIIPEEKIDYFCELKIDGLAVELVYEDGFLKIGSTRGDGIIGEDVTQNIKTIDAVPLQLFQEKDKKVVVQGEVFISKKEFFRLNEERKKEELPLYANPRNIAAGSLRQLDPKIPASRNLDFFAYDLAIPFGLKTHKEKHQLLRKMGFKTVGRERYCPDIQAVFDFYKEIEKERESYSYQIDGVVVFVSDNNLFERLGAVGKAPRGAFAYKFPLEQSTTVIEDVHFQIGRTGAVTPVAILKPFLLGGVTVSRATLHNEDEIKRLGIKIKDTVVVGRAGDVIPRVIKVIPEMRTGKEKKIVFPEKCPLCKGDLVRLQGEARWYCKNKNCAGTAKEKLYHFVSKKGFDIDGFGKKAVFKLFDEKVISTPADIFKLKEGDLLPLERFAEKSAKNIISAINKKKKITLSKFLQAISIPGVGEETARVLSFHFNSLENIYNASLEDLEKINDIGPITAKEIRSFFDKKENREMIEEVIKCGVVIEKEERDNLLENKTFVITGSLETMKREEVENKIVQKGGKVSSSISAKTNYLVVGKNPGSKKEKAKNLGVKIITEKELLEIIK